MVIAAARAPAPGNPDVLRASAKAGAAAGAGPRLALRSLPAEPPLPAPDVCSETRHRVETLS